AEVGIKRPLWFLIQEREVPQLQLRFDLPGYFLSRALTLANTLGLAFTLVVNEHPPPAFMLFHFDRHAARLLSVRVFRLRPLPPGLRPAFASYLGHVSPVTTHRTAAFLACRALPQG